MGAFGLSGDPAAAADIRGKGDKCIDIPDGSTKPGTRVHYWPCDGSPEQQWTVRDGRIIGKGGLCLDLPHGDAKDGARIHIWTCDGSAEQRWDIANGEIRMKGKCLDLPSGSTKDGTPIQLWPCDGSPEQKWKVPVSTAGGAPDPAETMGRVMALMVYAEVCKIPVPTSRLDALMAAGQKLQSKLGVSEADMDKIGGEIRSVAPSRCDTMRAGYDRATQETLAMAAQIP